MSTFPFSRTLTAGRHFLSVTDLNVLADTTDGTVELVLPNIATLMEFVLKQGYSVGAAGVFSLNISDVSGNAATNNITIVPADNNYLSDSAVSVVISTNNGSAIFKPTSSTLWFSSISSTSNVTPPSSGVDCFVKTISGAFNTNDVQNTFDECYMYLDNGTYIFDVDYNFRTTGTVGNSLAEIRTNISSDDVNVMPEDIIVASRTSEVVGLQVGSLISAHLMTGKIVLDAGAGNSPVFKAAFADTADLDMQVLSITMRAIKIG